jgi:hypothetical protein
MFHGALEREQKQDHGRNDDRFDGHPVLVPGGPHPGSAR